MAYVSILAASVGVGVLVYQLALLFSSPVVRPDVVASRSGDASESPPPEPSPDEPDTAFLPVSVSERSWRTRLTGGIGLVLMVVAAGAILAMGLYQAGLLIARMLSKAADSGTAAGAIFWR
jgi:hypothetical protein